MKMICAAVLLFGANAFAHQHGPGMQHLVFANGAVHAHATWVKGPQTPAESQLQIEWRDGGTHTPAEPPGTFAVKLWMPDMGHGSSPVQITQTTDSSGKAITGTYLVSMMYFTMGGKWDVNVTLKYADGREETQKIKVELGGGHGH
jgi:hypothetical protein